MEVEGHGAILLLHTHSLALPVLFLLLLVSFYLFSSVTFLLPSIFLIACCYLIVVCGKDRCTYGF